MFSASEGSRYILFKLTIHSPKIVPTTPTMDDQTIILSQDATNQLALLQKEKLKKVLECKRIDAKIRRASFLGLQRANARRVSGPQPAAMSSCKKSQTLTADRPCNPYTRKKLPPRSQSSTVTKINRHCNPYKKRYRHQTVPLHSNPKRIDGDDYLKGVDLNKLFSSFSTEPPSSDSPPLYHDTYETPFALGFTVWKKATK